MEEDVIVNSEVISDDRICKKEKIKSIILSKIYESIRRREFFFLTKKGYCDECLFISFPHYFDKYDNEFQEARIHLQKDGWTCATHKAASTGANYYLVSMYSKKINASNIEFATTNSTRDFIYDWETVKLY